MVSKVITSAVVAGLAVASSARLAGKSSISRPNIEPYPKTLSHPLPTSPQRNKTCSVTSRGSGDDDASAILQAFNDCNNGGTVVLDSDYTIGTALDLTFLNGVDVALSGSITFTDDIDYWVENSFKYDYQNSSTFWKFGGKDVNIYGGGIGLLDGNGQAWYDQFAAEPTLLRPITLVLDGLQGGSWFNLIANSSDILVSDVTINVGSTSSNPAKNTDGWDTLRSDSVVIQDSIVNNGDDCVSFKPNSTNIVVQGLSCNGSHGISVGSLGQYPLEYDIVENVYVYNNTMSNAGDGARIKVWPGIDTAFEPGLNGGGGAGYVRNVTYEMYHNVNNDWIIELNQCYGQSNTTLCQMYPSNMTISDIYFLDFTGTSSKKYDPRVGTLVCSSSEQCYNIHARNISITPPSGKAPQWICNGFDTVDLEGFNCTSS
ncbi:glycoside hydrolase family 28 protein [Pseudomassariella vexata]|uniref:galacturonan 1,4-alpha-galacturonidase n=1 Tax=Pseudomassariella vexata TaxID=1141098 RepID=A0A1Y2DMV4_9PEZI|nr:glycoside hydrolase family 28 protein [Pseudomassariella vexata]ORY60577.1 glycoside hydrolase family 28 protein [Pseudomassariella vexata]